MSVTRYLINFFSFLVFFFVIVSALLFDFSILNSKFILCFKENSNNRKSENKQSDIPLKMKEPSSFKENINKTIQVNQASGVTSLISHNRSELNSIGSDDSAFYELNDVNGLKVNSKNDGFIRDLLGKIGNGIVNLKTNSKNDSVNFQKLENELL